MRQDDAPGRFKIAAEYSKKEFASPRRQGQATAFRGPAIHVLATGRELAGWWKKAHPETAPVGANLPPFDTRLARG